MKFVDEIYRDLADESYKVEYFTDSKVWRKGDKVNAKETTFEVLKTEDNGENGMQAMAVAPVIDGKVDTSQIVIAYAGTNSSDIKDISTDVVEIGLNKNGVIKYGNIAATVLNKYVGTNIEVEDKGQLKSAEKFADEVIKEYPEAKINFTGHSLGAFLAMCIAIKKKSGAVVFNGPQDFTKYLTNEEIEWIKNNVDQITNYRNVNDFIGNIGKDEYGIAIEVDMGGELKNWLSHHALSTWKFNDQGQLVDHSGKVVVKNTDYLIDVDKDGLIDFYVPKEKLEAKLPLIRVSGSGSEIKINKESLNNLSTKLKETVGELETLEQLLKKTYDYNEEIRTKKPTRQQTLREAIASHLHNLDIIKLIEKIDMFYLSLDTNKNTIKTLADYNTYNFTKRFTQNQPANFIAWCYSNGSRWDEHHDIKSKLKRIVEAGQSLYQEIYYTAMEDPKGTLCIGKIVELSTHTRIAKLGEMAINQIDKKIEESTKGEGNRNIYEDGIVEALKEVMEVEKENIANIKRAYTYLATVAKKLVEAMTEQDENLGNYLKKNSGLYQNYEPTAVQRDYTTFLKETGILDDVDILKAFDRQVDLRAEEITQDVYKNIGSYVQKVDIKVRNAMNKVIDLKEKAGKLDGDYETSIYYKRMVNKPDGIGSEIEYYTMIEREIEIADDIKNMKNYLTNFEESNTYLPFDVNRAKNNLPHIRNMIRSSIEDVTYGNSNLDSIVKSHRAIGEILGRMGREALMLNSLLVEANSGESVRGLSNCIEEVILLTDSIKKMIDSCFGNKA